MIFNSRNQFYKNPCGPVTTGTSVTFQLKLAKNLGASQVYFCIAKDHDPYQSVPMEISVSGDEYDIYQVTYTMGLGAAPYWYYFHLTTNEGERYISRDVGGEGKLCGMAHPFQQTVYTANIPIPKWFGQGITYQIFPDRFCRTRIPRAMEGRKVHRDWNDSPVYLPDEKGEILNNDFFGGNLKGIIEKLDYLESLGVTTIYMNPIFMAYSNHRYDTGDYKRLDKYVGTEKDFKELCKKAKAKGMRIMLDGVFSHTGYDSLYFNGKGNYEEVGAFQSPDSPYASWYTFQEFPHKYNAWWGFYTLPEVNELDPNYIDYIIEGKDSAIDKWMKLGASGYRLDVADELPDEFIQRLNKRVKENDPEGLVLGEVWEDASNKESYDVRRKYVYGLCLDSVMNYVFKDAILHYMGNGYGQDFRETMETLQENYPPDFFYNAMNILGTHDTARALTALSGKTYETRENRAKATLSKEDRAAAVSRLKLATLIQYTMPGSPAIYYGDEVGLEGYEDPFNRRTYPWGNEDQDLLAWYRYLGKLRKEHSALVGGTLKFLHGRDDIVVYRRQDKAETVDIYINRSEWPRSFWVDGVEYFMAPFAYRIITT